MTDPRQNCRRTTRLLWIVVVGLAFIVGVLITGCTLMGTTMMDPEDLAQTVKLLEATKATGCTWLRGRGNPPAAQIELDMIYSFGGNNYLECVRTLRGSTGE